MDNYSSTSSNASTRKSTFRNLQPRAATTAGFDDSDDDDMSGLMRSKLKTVQRSETQDLADFLRSTTPPPSQAPNLPSANVVVDEKKKRTLLQRLRAGKSNLSSRDRNSVLVPPLQQRGGTGSSISTGSRGDNEVATLPNGKKYIMIAVDYKHDSDGESAAIQGANGVDAGRQSITSASLPKRSSRGEESGLKRASLLKSNPDIQVTTTIDDNHYNGNYDNNNGNNNYSNNSSKRSSFGTDKRRSIVIQAGGGEGSSFMLDDTPFLLDNFALDTDFIMPASTTATDQNQSRHHNAPNGRLSPPSSGGGYGGHSRTSSSRSGYALQGSENGSKRGTKVTFNIADRPEHNMDEDAVSRALTNRIASYKAQMAKGMLPPEPTDSGYNSSNRNNNGNDAHAQERSRVPEVILPKPVSRKKVRHVQIQTQHCIMRPMYTQTEPDDFTFAQQDLDVKEFATQTCFTDSASGTTEIGTSTDSESTVVPSINSVNPPDSKVANLIASLTQSATHSTSTGTITATDAKSFSSSSSFSSTQTSTTTTQDQEELIRLRQQNIALKAQVSTLQRDLAAETRARARTAVAMQDTRDKFEMLSAMAYKKLKEMIFQRHVLEMEVRELRAQVDMLSEEGDLYNQRHHSSQEYITIGL
ncbi:hypothetical protein EDD21DRAFT_419318 [Dissophora ornata]|nr:hypothetical protein BGZ58_007061 [Dissophora ornata]KAI8596802.1 hypothetical protein EDD21DRAFT_419318 [Dissophora ornata]